MINQIINHKVTIYLISSIIPLLSISIFLADLTLSILSIVFLIFLIRNNHLIFYKNIFFIIILLFYFICLTSSLLSENILFSLKSSIPFIRLIIFIFLLCYLIEKNVYFIDVFYNFIKFTLIILSIYGLLSYYYEYNLLVDAGELNLSHVRLELPMSDEQKLGSFLARIYGLFLALHIIKKNSKKFDNFFLFFLTISVFLVILFSGERSSLFFIILFFTICLILLDIDWKIKLTFFLSFIILIFYIFTINTNLANRIIFDKGNKFNLDSENFIVFTPQHTSHYKTALNIFFEKPIIGQGPRMFRKLCHKKKYDEQVQNIPSGCSSHPHNTYIQLLAETGIIGTLLFSLGFFHIVFNLTRHFLSLILNKGKKLNNYQIIISATTLIVFWPFSPSGNFFNNWLSIMYAIPLSFYVNEYFIQKNFNKI